jgi:hypothetical protein
VNCALLTWPDSLATLGKPDSLSLTQAEMDLAEELLREHLKPTFEWMKPTKKGYRRRSPADRDLVLERLPEYYRQYAITRASDGHVLVYLNGFPERRLKAADALLTWRESWVTSSTGGAWYFQALFDLTERKVMSFRVAPRPWLVGLDGYEMARE